MDTPVHRRGVKRHADGTSTGLPHPRSMSNLSSSSTSSDILVAPAPTSATKRQRRQVNATMPVTAVVEGNVLVIKGVGPLLEQWASRDQANNNSATNKNSKQAQRAQDNGAFRRITISSLTDSSTLLDDDEDGPNHKGTYSKAYTIKHPEIKWVHRGQGRYLPTETVSTQESRIQSGLTPQSKPAITPRFSGRSSLRRRSGDVEVKNDDDGDDEDDDGDVDVDDDEVPFTSQRSQASKRLSDASYSLRNRQSEADPLLTPGELRAARQKRRSGPLTNFEDDNDDDDAEDESESGDDGMKTYTKEYKEAHPEHNWRHCGNGFYKKGDKPSIPSSQYGSRRGSSRSQIKTESDLPPPSQEVKRYRIQDFSRFPGDEPVHCGNGWYRRKSSLQGTPDQRRRSSLQETPNQRRRSSLQEAPDQSAIESSDEEVAMKDGKFSKEEMVKYKNNFPDAQFVHRGNGRYVLTDDFGTIVPNTATKPPVAAAAPATPATEEAADKTFSKAYVKQHPNETFFHAGSGRYRRGSRPKRPSDVSRKPDTPVVEKPAIPTGLVNKDFVLAHPEMEFHHRGQGRYMYGPRPLEPVSAPPREPTPVKEPTPSPVPSEPELVDTAYVEAHPHETFHHRGQGRWARGLPPPGSSNKTAVRGPMASQAKFSVTPSYPPPEDLPGENELLIRAEGPDKYPHLEWVYRGGGKWARTAKSKQPVPKTSRARVSRGTAKAQDEEQEEEEDSDDNVVYTDDEYPPRVAYEKAHPEHLREIPKGPDGRRVSLNRLYKTQDQRMDAQPQLQPRRQRTAYQRADPTENMSRQTSKNPSQKSKTATPKPQRVTLEEDRLSDEDNYPSLYAKTWPPPRNDEPFDEASRVMRRTYKPINSPDLFVNALTRRDPATRPKEVLLATVAHAQKILLEMQNEYLELDKITAPHARVPRKPAKGGRVPLDHAVFEDKKEADLYDYTFDARKIGYQDPDAQKIYRDAEGRALRKRRQRNGLDAEPAATTGGEEAPLGPRRAVKPISRFDGTSQAAPATRKKRTNNGTLKPVASTTPDPTLEASSAAQPQVLANGYKVRTSGRWAGHVPKRIRELRGDSAGASTPSASTPAVASTAATGGATSPNGGNSGAGAEEGAARSETPGTSSDTPGPDGKEGSPGASRKGRPKGSKNLHKRRDAGIPKGPRKPKVVPSIEENHPPPMGYGFTGGLEPAQMMYGAAPPGGGLGRGLVPGAERAAYAASAPAGSINAVPLGPGRTSAISATPAEAAALAAAAEPPRTERNDYWSVLSTVGSSVGNRVSGFGFD
jgi:hypothetical protein